MVAFNWAEPSEDDAETDKSLIEITLGRVRALFKNCNRELYPLVNDTLTLTLGAIAGWAPAPDGVEPADCPVETASANPGAVSTLFKSTPDPAAAFSI